MRILCKKLNYNLLIILKILDFNNIFLKKRGGHLLIYNYIKQNKNDNINARGSA